MSLSPTTRHQPSEKPELPPILAGSLTPRVRQRVVEFYLSVARLFESWVRRRQSPHTQRAYREDVMSFIAFLGLDWPKDAHELLRVTVGDVQVCVVKTRSEAAEPSSHATTYCF
jgi:site-specific recombinase XerD